ncbi:glycosyl hydrolase family 25 [Pediococcus argentinicus]|uniref:Glycosyl hydrolase family 25 n=1 Tax=Pediococcus argentinicus TaxID=480391 RepID=A0A0R2NJQ1_9LACO|nr:glycosyl hydrolase family 25 [Pediococcus argentinicus]
MLLPFLFSLKAHADALPSMSGDRVLDVSKYNGNVNWKQVKQDKKIKTRLAIVRVQHGPKIIDEYQKIHANGLSNAGIPFGTYAFSEFKSVSDARNQAKMFYKLSDKRTKFYVLDDEKHMGKGKEQSYINAWLSQMRKLTNKKLVFYSYRNFISEHNIKYSGFDGLWLACYQGGSLYYNPDLWQYAPTAKVKGLPGKSTVDISYMRHASTVMSWLQPYTKVKYRTLKSSAIVARKNYDIWQHVPNSSPKIKSVSSTHKYASKDLSIGQTGMRLDNGVVYYKITYKHNNIGWVNKNAIKLVTYKKVSYSKPKQYKGHPKKTSRDIKLYNHVPESSFNAEEVSKGLSKKDKLSVDLVGVRSDKSRWIRVKKSGSKYKYWISESVIKYDQLKSVSKRSK